MRRIRVFITDGDQLVLQNACDKFKCEVEFGGNPACDGNMPGFEREQEPESKMQRIDWVPAYINVTRWSQALGIRCHFKHEKGRKHVQNN